MYIRISDSELLTGCTPVKTSAKHAMSTAVNHLVPGDLIHPGEILSDELEAREISQKDFAIKLGIQPSLLNEIIKGKRGITAEHALLIGKELKMDPLVWKNLQSNFELDKERVNQKTQQRLFAIDQWNMIEGMIPAKFFKKQAIISGDPTIDIQVIKSIYRINHLEQLPEAFSKSIYARFRKSDKLTTDKINLIGWINLVKFKAQKINVKQFDRRKEGSLTSELKITIQENKNVLDKCATTLENYGIKLIIQSHPEKCPIDGVSFWSNGNPAIGLTLRHKRLDNFTFTLFHELGHIFTHLINNNNAEFIDIDKNEELSEYQNSNEEKEANSYANDTLINRYAWIDFFSKPYRLQKAAVADFAHSQNIHPAIVKGRLSHELNSFSLKLDIDNAIN